MALLSVSVPNSPTVSPRPHTAGAVANTKATPLPQSPNASRPFGTLPSTPKTTPSSPLSRPGGGGKGGALTTKQVAPPMDFETFRDYLGRLETGTPADKDLLLELYDRTLKRAFSHVEVCIIQDSRHVHTHSITAATSSQLTPPPTHFSLPSDVTLLSVLMGRYRAGNSRANTPHVQQADLSTSRAQSVWRRRSDRARRRPVERGVAVPEGVGPLSQSERE